MSQKVRKTLIMIVMAALIICLMAASLTYTFTYGRYAGGKFDEESPYDDLIEFVGAREYTVRSPEELIQAIEDGYSNIKIADDAEEPFVITEGVTDVTANLVLNLNGKVVVRNSRNPMLDVQTNVSVVLVYDSTNKGAFYNPVGSSLMASGGSLTVGSGGYESGPRAKEYQGNEAAGTLSKQPSDVAIYTRGGITSPSAVNRTEQLSYTKIDTKIDASSNFVPATSGRYYRETADSDYTLVPADTFLIYTVEKDCFIGDGTSSGGVKFELGQLYVNAESEKVGNVTTVTASEFTTPLCNVASCDFYYYYPIGDDDNDGYKDYAVIYGYWDVMKLARDDGGAATALKGNGLIWPYAAVRMVEGEGIVRGGTFSNHFDAVNTYGIYAEGGTLAVSQVPVTSGSITTNFTTGGDGVCIRVSSSAGGNEGEDEGGTLDISGGSFSSEIGNTIEMSGGTMNVTAGTFTKDASAAATASTDNGSAIDIQGGTLTMTGSDAKTFTITGSHVNGIKSSGGGTVKAENATFSLNGGGENGNNYGTDMFGINIDSGTVEANGCEITIYGTYSAGILSAGNANVSLGATNRRSEIAVWIPTDNGAEKKLSSSGVSSEGGSITLTGNVLIDTNGLGITARGLISISKGETEVYTDYGTGVLVSGEAGGDAKIVVAKGAVLSVDSKIDSDWGWVLAPGHEDEGETIEAINKSNGIYVENGSIDASAGTLNVTHTGVASDGNAGMGYSSYAVSVESGNVTLGSGAIAGNSAGGIYVSGGELTAGAVTVSAGGTVQNDNFTANASTYASGVLVKTGTVTLSGAKIYSTALGVAVLGGNFKTEGTSSVTATRATGVYVQGGTVTNSGTLDVTSTISSTWENEGADFDNTSFKTSRFNGIFVNGGSLNSAGTLNVTHTGVATAEDPNATTSFPTTVQTKSYAVYVTGKVGSNTDVEIGSGTINAAQAGGVYVENGAVSLGASSKTVAINTGGWDDTQDQIVSTQGTYASAVYAKGGTVTMNGTININSAAIGIVATAADTGTGTGAVTIESGSTTIHAYRSTGVYIRGGSLKNSGTLSVESKITNSTGETASTAEEAYKWAGADISGDTGNSNIYNGVFVNGGSLVSTGTLNVTFTGVQNAAFNTETQEGKVNTSYLNQQIKSYAVRVDNGNAIIVLGEIKNGVGGGVLVNGGTVELGAVDAENDDLIVSTTGSNYDDQTHYVTGNQWQYDWTLTGGHAVAVEGGTLNIYSGTYTAQMGNGILVRNLASDSTQNTVTVKDGIFEGYNGSGRRVGPGAFYALKVMGGPLTLNINGGTFGKALVNDEVPSTNGGAFVMGNPDAKERATVNVTNASFNSYNSDTFAVFRYVDASFGSSEGTGNVSMTVTKAANEGSDFAAIGVQNDLVYNNDAHSDRGSTITIASGSYTGGFGIWYGSSTDTVNISDGTFTGTARPGLFFAENPGSNVTLSGGLYQGGSGAIDAGDQASPRDIMTGDIIANDAYCFNQYVDGQGDTNKAYAICNRVYNPGVFYDNYHVGGNDRNKNVRLNETTYINGSNGQAFNRRTIIFISNQNGYVSNYTTSIW